MRERERVRKVREGSQLIRREMIGIKEGLDRIDGKELERKTAERRWRKM